MISLGDIVGGQLTNMCTWSLLTTLSNNPYIKGLARLPDKLPYPLSYYSSQYLVAILRNPHKVILYLVYRVAAIPVIHTLLTPLFGNSIAAKADRLKPVV